MDDEYQPHIHSGRLMNQHYSCHVAVISALTWVLTVHNFSSSVFCPHHSRHCTSNQAWKIKQRASVTEFSLLGFPLWGTWMSDKLCLLSELQKHFKLLLLDKQFRMTCPGFQLAHWAWFVQKEPCLHKQQSSALLIRLGWLLTLHILGLLSIC